ncbi:DUF4871 domain-containing protein [Paenibacillus sp. KQZ6P-2]|uniref:DUF4871 domain-containing protein n=1 Tax=Paenibacillus mangrovi TaxID=2931978 RepID=A0A9X1WPL4_9BACL|nr:DUF4871 domain-containing protein [Paenibacillus mangrovi]MCJ8011650.1 DUF4871 domain-containing protein [Paenibacillus mangrovi]
MKSTRPEWYEELKHPPFGRNMFTPEMEMRVRHQLASKKQRSSTLSRFILLTAACSVALAFVLLFMYGMLPAASKLAGWVGIPVSKEQDWLPHSVYKQGSAILLETYPGGDYHAGKRSGSWWNIHEPYEQLQNSTIQITATHRQSGTTIIELQETPIDQSMIYADFIRVSSDFALPFPGTWKFDVCIDGMKIGDTVFEVPDSDWQPSPQFEYDSSTLTGNRGRSGFVSSGFTAGSGNKFLWHLWDTKELSGRLVVKAVKKNSTQVLTILDTELSGSQEHQTLPSLMELPESGLWRLMIYVDNKFFDSIVVKVKEPGSEEMP